VIQSIASVVVSLASTHLTNGFIVHGNKPMTRRESGPMDVKTAAGIMLILLTGYSAWLTSIVFCASNGMRPLLIAGAAFFGWHRAWHRSLVRGMVGRMWATDIGGP
jgi:hypothetical protein